MSPPELTLRMPTHYWACFFAAVLVSDVMVGYVASMPQCLDFRPPFSKGTKGLIFCHHHSEFGCCTSKEDEKLRNESTRLQGHTLLSISNATWARCASRIKELLCTRCSPHSLRMYGVQVGAAPKSLPSLCPEYCRRLFDQCGKILEILDPSLTNAKHFESAEAFCQWTSMDNEDNCFPEIRRNEERNKEIEREKWSTPGCLCLEELASDLRNPIFARHPNDSTGRLFVAEQIGLIHVYFARNKTKLPQPFLDLTAVVKSSARKGDARGLLGMTFHPQYRTNGKFFVHYTANVPPGQEKPTPEEEELGITVDNIVKVVEFKVSSSDPNVADPQSERVVLEVRQPAHNHNGGELFFGDDGYLYVSLGDGGGAGDPHGFAQNKASLLGKILRLDVNTDAYPGLPYGSPVDNPFKEEEGVRPEIFALGLRNPWRCGKDRGDPVTGEGKGRIICGDVGQSDFEELDILKKGGNYGWNSREGHECYKSDTCGQIGPEELPIHVYQHTEGKAVIGGHFYRGCESPNLNGYFFFGDYFRGRIFRLSNTSTGEWQSEEVLMCGADQCKYDLSNDPGRFILSFGEDEDGEVYLLTSSDDSSVKHTGSVHKLVDPLRRGNPASCEPAQKEGRVPLPFTGPVTSPATDKTSSVSKMDLTMLLFISLTVLVYNRLHLSLPDKE